MRLSSISALLLCSVATSIVIAPPALAQSHAGAITVPAMPLGEALRRIGDLAGTTIAFDPDAVAGHRSKPVRGATTADEAAQAAVAGTGLTVAPNPNGGLMVVGDIVVTAHRDEAETSVLVNRTSTSSRLGQSLREQARNTQVISAKVLAEQQAQTISDALRNAGGVSVNAANVQSGTSYSVRGFGSNGVLNGLPAANNAGGVAAGSTVPIANIERIEVLKGPDALLAGVDNLGGTINLVTKKPGADPYAYLSAEGGSFGHWRVTGDATGGLNGDKTLSARLIGTASKDDHNFGGYRGNEDYLIAPSVRFKDARTDVTLGFSASKQVFGLSPFVPVDPATNEPVDYPHDRAIASPDQYIRTVSRLYYGEVRREAASWLTLTVRAQHQDTTLDLHNYAAFAPLDTGLLLLNNGEGRQKGVADAVDAFARIDVKTGPITHKLAAGYTYVRNRTTSFSASQAAPQPFDIFHPDAIPLPALLPVDEQDYRLVTEQKGIYAQYMAAIWRLHLIAGFRHNRYDSDITFPTRTGRTDGAAHTTPNYGVVLDVTKDISAFASLAYGYSPSFALDRNRNKLPDNSTRNAEAGLKVDLLKDKLFLVGSWFRLRESNVITADPTNFRYSIALPGRVSSGVDLNLTGQPLKGWTIQTSYTRTKYRLEDTTYGDTVVAVPRDLYSVYTSYKRSIGAHATAGLGGGVYGRSSAAADSFATVIVPPAVQVDLNAFLTVGKLDVNLGVRNVLDRNNYGVTYTPAYIPLGEPRSWKLTVGYRFR